MADPKKQNKVEKKKKAKVASPKVKVVVNSSFNNTIVSVTDYSGAVIATSSAGQVGFSGSRKSTAYAASKAGEDAARKAAKLGAQEAIIIVKGVGEGRQSAIKGVRSAGLRITSLSDYTPIPHGGCKPRKMPRK
ncbi:MAG: 30S ribosomal protein S11 [Candidatus Doudnabacteria bacterium]|nr:30S ribosomal protein S11 [Candidatus Doudnabacteria bacterium]